MPPYNPHFLECVGQLRPHYRLGIISGGIELVAEQVRKELDLEFQLSNTIGVSHGTFDGTYRVGVPFYDKITSLKGKAQELNLDLAEICFVGDSINDIECLEVVGLPIAYCPRYEQVATAAKGNVIEDFAQLPDFIRGHSV